MPQKLINYEFNNLENYYYWFKRICSKACDLLEKETDEEGEESAQNQGHNHKKLLRVYIKNLLRKYKILIVKTLFQKPL